MDSHRWQKIKSILETALDLPLGEQSDFLSRSCGDDESLLKEVHSLWQAGGDGITFIDHPITHFDAADAPPPPRIGRYKIERELGRGGMGTVFLGVRDDETFQKRVAVKVLHPNLETQQFIRSFNRERQILADLNHPNIAGLLDGGTTAGGRPYLVMEYVEGTSILRYCREHRLSTAERLQLYRKLCSAVHFAHRNLVVHRDIKPGNILVTPEGEPKLLDFGIAKILQKDPANSRTTIFRPMTPEYASPEQITGETVTTASDIYSLGVLGYELLTGRRPYRLGDTWSDLELRLAICEQPPIRPSLAIEAEEKDSECLGPERKKTKNRLAGDLDNILMMALRKEPDRRYASAQQLSEDIHRYLKGFPVLAAKDTLGYFLGKFVRRHRLAVSAALLVFITVLGLVIGILLQHRTALRERDRAERERGTKESVSNLLVDAISETDPFRFDIPMGRPPVREKGTLSVKDLLANLSIQVRTETMEDTALQASLMTVIGSIYTNLEMFDEARPLLENARHSLERSAFKGSELFEVYYQLGWLTYLEGLYPQAMAHLEEAQTILNDTPFIPHRKWVELRNVLALTLYYQGRWEDAARIYRQLLDDPELHDVPALKGVILSNLGLTLYRSGRYDQAVTTHSQAVALLERTLGDQHPRLADSLDFLGIAYRKTGLFIKAKTLFGRALAIRQTGLDPEHPNIARSFDNLGLVEYQLKQYDNAERYFLMALEMKEKVYGGIHDQIAETLNHLAIVYRRRDQSLEAEICHQQVLAIRKQIFEPGNLYIGVTHHNLSNAYLDRGLIDEAEYHHRQAYGIFLDILGQAHPDFAYSLHVRARIEEAKGQVGAAYRTAGKGLRILQETASYQDNHPAKSEMCDLLLGLEDRLGPDRNPTP